MPNDFTAENNCVALYRFESGEFADDSKGTNDLSDVNTVTVETTLYKEDAQAAKHVRSATEYFYLSDSALSADFPGKSGTSNGSLSFCAWVRFTSLASARGFANKFSGSSGNRGWSLSIGASLNLNLTKGLASDASATETLSHGSGFVTGRWYHVGVTYNNTDKTARIRIWDDTAGTILGTDATTTFSDYIYIGGAGFTLGSNHDGIFDEVVVFNRALTADEIDSIRRGQFGAGGNTYTETLDTLITSISSAADQQAYRDTVDTLITSGATVEAVTGMVEALLSLGVSASTVGDVQGYADGVSDTIISASDTADAQDYVDGPATTGVSSSDESDTQAYADSLADTLVSASGVTDTTGTPPVAESLLTTAVSASNVSAAQAYVETITALAVSASSIGEVLGLVEQIGTVGESISAVSDRKLYYDNVAIVALSSSSLAEVGAYIEQVSAAAVSASSLTDVLVGSFVGRYVFADYCRPRSFADYARARSFEDYCRPRGRRLQ